MEQLRANIVNLQPEYANGLGTMSRVDVIIELYQRLFAREPEREGLIYWSTGDGRHVNVDQLVFALSEGASAVDRRALSHKTEAATYYTQTIPTYEENQAQLAVSTVTDVYSTVEASKAQIDQYLDDQGETIQLTTGLDDLTGTAANDVFSAIGSETVTQATDTIDGGAGTDTLRIDSSGDANTLTGNFNNLEKLVFTGNGLINNNTVIDVSKFSDGFTLDGTQDTVVAIENLSSQLVTLHNVASSTRLQITATEQQTTANLAFSSLANHAEIALTGSALDTVDIQLIQPGDGLATVTDTGNTITTANISANASSHLNLATAQLQTVMISGSGHVTLTTSAGPAVNLNASASTAGVTLTNTLASTALFTGSSAGDTITYGATTQQNRMGGGNDTAFIDSILALGNGGEIDGGSGTDSLHMNAATASSLSADNNFSSKIAGFEKLILTDATNQTINLANLDSLTDISLSGNGNSLVLDNLANNSTITLTNSSTQTTFNVANAATSEGDQLNLIMESADALAAGIITMNGVENLTIQSRDSNDLDHSNSLSLNADALTSLTLSGDTQLDLTLTGATALSSVNAATQNGGVTLDISTVNSVTFVGSSAADTVTLGNLSTATGGTGNDAYIIKTAQDNDSFARITDFQQGDNLRFFGITDSSNQSTFGSSRISLDDGATLDQFLDEAANGTVAAAHAILRWFQFENNTYLVNDRSTEEEFQAGVDQVIVLSGLVDLSSATLNNDLLTLM